MWFAAGTMCGRRDKGLGGGITGSGVRRLRWETEYSCEKVHPLPGDVVIPSC